MGASSALPPFGPAPQTTSTPKSSSAPQGSSRPPIGEQPTAVGSARASTSRRMRPGSKGMKLPTASSTRSTASTNARSGEAPSISIRTHFARRSTASRGTAPDATSPAAAPAAVASTATGKTLLVPVERGTRGASSQACATTRWVPSPPSTTRTSQPRSRIAQAARSESPARSSEPTSTISISAPTSRFSTALVAMRKGSFITMTRRAPPATAPIATRAT
jgi:hypothetical protein